MTTGNWSVTLDSYNKASKTWSGADGLHSQEHSYSCDIKRMRSTKFERWSYAYGNRKKPPSFTGYTYVNPFHSSGFISEPTFDSSADFQSKVRLADAIRGHNWNAGVSLATLPQAVSQIKNAATAGLGLILAIKRGDVSGALRALARVPGQSKVPLSRQAKKALRAGDVSGAYLALQYGILPTVADTYNAVEAIDKGFRAARLSFRTSAKQKINLGWMGSGTTGLKQPPSEHLRIVSLRARLASRPYFAELSGLGLMDPASVIWELTPWSFVVDWFWAVGDYLRTVNTLYGYSAEVWKTSFVRRASAYTQGNVYVTAYDDFRNGSWKHEHITVSRSLDSLEVELPPFNWAGPLNQTRLQNAAALIHGLAGRARKQPDVVDVRPRSLKVGSAIRSRNYWMRNKIRLGD